MAEKTTKIADVKSPEKVTPAASSRPIVVNNRPVLNDPMMVNTKDPDAEPAGVVTRTAKTIKPISDTKEPSTEETAKTTETPSEPTSTEATPDSTAEQAEITAEPAATERDSEAEAASVEAEAAEALTAREQELEQLIASGKYAVPIDAVQRKRSRMNVILLCLVALVLAVVLADALFDAGIIKPPTSIPHTHFFKTTN